MVCLAYSFRSNFTFALNRRLTKRAPDVWDSAAFSSIFLASSFSCSQTLSTPAHTQVTQAVRLVCRRAEIGDRLAWSGASAAVYGQAAGMEGVAGSLKFVRSGAGSPNPGARAQACRPTAGTGRLRAFRRQGMIRRQPAAADAGR